MTTDEIVTKLTEMGGNLWEKNGMKRIYFDAEQILKHAGLDVSYYGTGNVSGATLKGEKISNSEAKRILAAVGTCKFWYDMNDGEFHIKDSYNSLGEYKYMPNRFFKKLRAAIADVSEMVQ